MNKNFVLTLFAVIIAAMSVCWIAAAQETDYPFNPGASERYSYEDIKAAADVIMKEFSSWDGCELYLLQYAGDTRSQFELEMVKETYKETYDECMLFMSAFRSPEKETMAWAANEDYCWSWTLVRNTGGEWILKNWGWAEPNMKSDQYSVYDLIGGSETVRADLDHMEGVKVLNVSYTEDKNGAAGLEYINSLERGEFDECAVYEVWFMSPKEAYGAWEADTLYVWTWYLGRSDKGYWQTVNYGVG